MSILKFECPGCGQHLECDRACAGDIIHCPRCCAELRIPFSELPGAVLRAELISHGASSLAPIAPSPEPIPQTTDVICPVCESTLRVSATQNPKQDPHAPTAELIRKGPERTRTDAKGPQPEVKADKEQAESHPDFAHMTLEERERQIAAAREAHPIQINTPVKPRLDYVLSGGTTPSHKP